METVEKKVDLKWEPWCNHNAYFCHPVQNYDNPIFFFLGESSCESSFFFCLKKSINYILPRKLCITACVYLIIYFTFIKDRQTDGQTDKWNNSYWRNKSRMNMT